MAYFVSVSFPAVGGEGAAVRPGMARGGDRITAVDAVGVFFEFFFVPTVLFATNFGRSSGGGGGRFLLSAF